MIRVVSIVLCGIFLALSSVYAFSTHDCERTCMQTQEQRGNTCTVQCNHVFTTSSADNVKCHGVCQKEKGNWAEICRLTCQELAKNENGQGFEYP